MKIFLVVAVCFFLAGCGKANYQVNTKYAYEVMEEAKKSDIGFCESYARGTTPYVYFTPEYMPGDIPKQYVKTAGTFQSQNGKIYYINQTQNGNNISGNIQTSTGEVGYYHGTLSPDYEAIARYNSMAAAHAGAQNLGFAIGYAIAVTRKENDCMERLGWKKTADLTPDDREVLRVRSLFYKLYNEMQPSKEYWEVLYGMGQYMLSLSPEEQNALTARWIESYSVFRESFLAFREAYREAHKEPQKEKE